MLAARARDRRGVLTDSEATLRQIARLLMDMGAMPASIGADHENSFGTLLEGFPERAHHAELLEVVVRSYGRIMHVIQTLRADYPDDEPRLLREVEHELARVVSAFPRAESAGSSPVRGVGVRPSLLTAHAPGRTEPESPAARPTPAEPAK